MKYTRYMDKLPNNKRSNIRMRLGALALALVIGLVMGWLNGRASITGLGVATDVTADQRQSPAPETPSASPTTEPEQSLDTQGDAASADTSAPTSTTTAPTRGPTVDEDGWYTSKDEVALYIHSFGHLPGNFISKTKARERGWVAAEGNLDEVCPGMSIGGGRFYNDDGTLPDASGRTWTECDIDYQGGFRGPKRIVFSNDGLIYYTEDHYETFEQLY